MLQPKSGLYSLVVPALAEVMTAPGAATFGFMRPPPVGPRLLPRVMAPTER